MKEANIRSILTKEFTPFYGYYCTTVITRKLSKPTMISDK